MEVRLQGIPIALLEDGSVRLVVVFLLSKHRSRRVSGWMGGVLDETPVLCVHLIIAHQSSSSRQAPNDQKCDTRFRFIHIRASSPGTPATSTRARLSCTAAAWRCNPGAGRTRRSTGACGGEGGHRGTITGWSRHDDCRTMMTPQQRRRRG